ncbi:hypothetical protein CONLIGDRAFT_217248 [Coniochaeta ligniaria NRRL 30616]|uniref:Nudix hydrolase domain-containing protein n=1 Tax=Coniochaeta ligniaria NRRL 30616 TaxID=1408157 RepID=A0A1J7I515_9PEZI|nr:hypothetical protein CONLIGDRAFT_217248 [Coniochaeta ligniaria NRRL 30616]
MAAAIPDSARVVAVRAVLSATDFYLAAGTVTIDPVERKILILHDLLTNTFQLPRGRKDWGEGLAETAVRETFEETGYRPRLLAVPLSTRATVPQTAAADPLHPCHVAARSARFDDETGDVLVPGSARLAEEPFALMQHYQANGALAVVSWFVGVADSHSRKELGTQMADEEYDSRWVGYDEAAALMIDDAYAEVIRRAVELATQVVEEDGATAVLSGRHRAGVSNVNSVCRPGSRTAELPSMPPPSALPETHDMASSTAVTADPERLTAAVESDNHGNPEVTQHILDSVHGFRPLLVNGELAKEPRTSNEKVCWVQGAVSADILDAHSIHIKATP